MNRLGLRTRFMTAVALGLGLGLAASCGPPELPEPVEPVEPAINSDELYSLDRLPRFDITLDAAAWAALEAEPKEWVRGRFQYEDSVYENVGVRLKGNHSFRSLDEKASFKIKFNEYISGTRFLGLEGLTLNSMVVDGSMLREWISYRVFRQLGVPAPRVGYAEVFVNDEPYGLYLNLEPYDDSFLQRVYADPTGNLYESESSADIHGDIEKWDQDEGSDHSRQDIAAFSELAQREGNEVFYGPESVVDMPRFLAFLAGEAIVGHFDGHMAGHNFFIYHEPAAGTWTYLPWGLDQALARRPDPYAQNGFLGDKCLHDERCLVDYVNASNVALTQLAKIDFEAEVAQAIELTDDAMREDPRRPYSVDTVLSGRERSLGYITTRADDLAPPLDCLVDGEQPDADGDGFGPCFQDCDESNPDIHPEAEELCDGIDNDCSGFIDDVPSCECPSVTVEGRTFYLCLNRLTWLQSREYCAEQGRVLAQFDSPEQMAEVWAAADEIASGRWAIGLNDREVEEDYRWPDGSAPTFSGWAEGEPAHVLDWFDCVFLHGDGLWHECNCIEKGSFICTDDESAGE
ncbi:MAG: CotH kinase family protein [Myxococcota bacterium]